MGDINQQIYLQKFYPRTSGPVLEVGSKDYGGPGHGATMPFRKMFPANEYLGVDLEAGKGVDRTIDLVEGTGDLPQDHFSLVICCSVMEHVTRPWKMAEHITRLMRPDGRLYISVPWVWRYHAYPDDYYRFSFRGIMQLFPELEWDHIHYSTTVPGEFLAVKPDALQVDNQMAIVGKTDKGRRKYLPYLMINMLGIKRAAATRAA